ncbi:protein trichome birefringence-like 5 [Salvia miltiorrhiza]|uniref:protein trichome birefringence-like 5 n=1 Tax=Salvia miltiorrhiza TaxID=226208 RepID=UPI0025ACA0F6|nr:protein trichome birefringence-like 5 [Salvia miltiorrhiza]
MAASSWHFTKKINRYNYKLLTLSLLLLSLFCFLLFNRSALDPKLRDLSGTPAPLPVSRSSLFHDEFDDTRQPISVSSNLEQNVTAASKFPEPLSSKSDLDDEPTNKTPEPSVASEPESEEDSSERKSEPASNEENDVHISSNSNLDDEAPQKTSEALDPSKSELSDEEKITLISSESDSDDKNSTEWEESGEKMEFLKEGASSNAETGGYIDNAVAEKLRNCDMYSGKWVKDEGYPLYRAGSCPYVDEAFDCQSNGRPDSGYTQWRWKPHGCELPRFNATDFLVRIRGKRLMLVGDSMNRNQFESLLCLLREGLPDKTKMYETRGNKITKGRGYFIFKFEDYNCTVEFVRSHFLVREGVRKNAQGNSNPTLSIDRIDKTAARWLRADILVFNTGHWWTHGKTSRGKNYYKEGDYIYPKFDAVEAYRRAIKTWATWIKNKMSRQKLVFYRGYSSAHFRGGDWDSGGSCNGETEPVVQGAIIDNYPQKMTIVEEILKETKVQAVLLNVTRLTNFRKDGHPSVYGKNVTGLKKVSTRRQDCSHWCLPGVPDAWNELIYATLVATQT